MQALSVIMSHPGEWIHARVRISNCMFICHKLKANSPFSCTINALLGKSPLPQCTSAMYHCLLCQPILYLSFAGISCLLCTQAAGTTQAKARRQPLAVQTDADSFMAYDWSRAVSYGALGIKVDSIKLASQQTGNLPCNQTSTQSSLCVILHPVKLWVINANSDVNILWSLGSRNVFFCFHRLVLLIKYNIKRISFNAIVDKKTR